MSREEEMLLFIEQAIKLAEGNEWKEYLLRCLVPARVELERQLGNQFTVQSNRV
jgi:hypothetical protein